MQIESNWNFVQLQPENFFHRNDEITHYFHTKNLSTDKTRKPHSFYLFDIRKKALNLETASKIIPVSKRLIHFPRGLLKKYTSSRLGAVRQRYNKTRESLLFLLFSTLYVRPRVHVVSVNETGNSLCTHFSWIMGVLSRPTSLFWNGLSLEQMHARRNLFRFLFTGIFGEPWEKRTRIVKHCKVWSSRYWVVL